MIKLSKVIMITLLCASALLTGCEKKEIDIKSESAIQQENNIEELKAFMSKQVGVDIVNIKYNNETKMFSMFGFDQISVDKLTELYNVNKVK